MSGHSQTSIPILAKEDGLCSPTALLSVLNAILQCRPLASCSLSNEDQCGHASQNNSSNPFLHKFSRTGVSTYILILCNGKKKQQWLSTVVHSVLTNVWKKLPGLLKYNIIHDESPLFFSPSCSQQTQMLFGGKKLSFMQFPPELIHLNQRA